MTNYSFVPKYFLIQSVAKGRNTVVTFTADHDYSVGEYISFRCDQKNKMVEINQKRGKILEMTSDTITVDIDSTNYTDFMFDLSVAILPIAVPAGSGVGIGEYVATVILSDVFDNTRVN
jgi:hypothetical protein